MLGVYPPDESRARRLAIIDYCIATYCLSHVEVFDFEGVFFDEVTARGNVVAHQD